MLHADENKKTNQKLMFDEPLKKRFIASKGKSYTGRLNALFRKSYVLETELNKDLYEFNLEEIEKLFIFLDLKNVTDTYNSIKYYLDFCKEQGLIENNLMIPLSPHDFEDLTENNRFRLNEEDLYKFMDLCYNLQDKLLLKLLFEGVCGKGYTELFNLKKSDIYWDTNTLELNCDRNGHRSLKVSDVCMNLLKSSLNETVFFFDNGEVDSGISGDYYCKNDYVLRTIKRTAKDETKRVDLGYINSRFLSFKKWFNQLDISPTAVHKSGMIKHAIDLSKKLGKPLNEFRHDKEWKIVSKRFPMKGKLNNDVFQYNSLFRDIKYDEIERLYGDYLGINFKLLDESNVNKDIIETKKRKTQSKFKKMMLEAYQGACAISGETTLAVLEACHIQNFVSEESNHYQNGILLRIDLHRLFDKGLIQITEDYTVSVSSKVISEDYQRFHGYKIMLPNNPNWLPSKAALRYRNEESKAYSF